MKLRRIAAAFFPVLAAILILLARCGRDNHAPVMCGIKVTTADGVFLGSSLRLHALATDEDHDALAFSWQASAGALSSASGESVLWTPTTAGSVNVTVYCEDGAGGADTLTRIVSGCQAWRSDSTRAVVLRPVLLPAAALTYVPFELEGTLPDGAVIDSAIIDADLEPDTIGEFFRTWVVTPDGSEVLVYDGLNGGPDVHGFLLQGIKGESMKGTWQLKVARDSAAIERYVAEAALRVCYRYWSRGGY